jgi:hypothetical protein
MHVFTIRRNPENVFPQIAPKGCRIPPSSTRRTRCLRASASFTARQTHIHAKERARSHAGDRDHTEDGANRARLCTPGALLKNKGRCSNTSGRRMRRNRCRGLLEMFGTTILQGRNSKHVISKPQAAITLKNAKP